MLVFVKLGGSLITDKNQACSARGVVISRLAQEVSQALQDDPALQIILGHGSGSFGHPPAKKYQTRSGVHSAEEWRSFIEVRRQADALHRIVMDELWQIGLNAISFPLSAVAITKNHAVVQWDTAPLHNALDHSLLPVVFGDVVFDLEIGGTILSTEEILAFLCLHLPIQRILIVGIEQGIWKQADSPANIYPVFTPALFHAQNAGISGSRSPDVTGGMRSKVEVLFSIINRNPAIQASIFSGKEEGNLYQALRGAEVGTVLKDHQ